MELFEQNNGIIVEDYVTNQTWTFGSEGIMMKDPTITLGNLQEVIDNPSEYIFVLDFDCPFSFPLNDNHKGSYRFLNINLNYSHRHKRRGKQEFSTLDVLRIPQFSSIRISGQLNSDMFQGRNFPDAVSKLPNFTWELITHLLKKINDVAKSTNQHVDLGVNRILSYRVYFFHISEKTNPRSTMIVPYTSLIDLRSPQKSEFLDEDILRLYLNEKIELRNFYKEYIPLPKDDLSFEDLIFRLVHDFAFYTSERPEAISKLDEESIRDLFLIPVKMFVPSSEGEAFNYDGKLDFKITNYHNKYESISGEYKVWRGGGSFEECFKQISEKHSTGNEIQVYILMINRNKKVQEIYDKALNLLIKKEAFVRTLDSNISLSKRQLFSKHLIKIRDFEVECILGIIDVYYEKV